MTFSLGKRERCALVGRNGSGKSTFFRLITKEETADEGDITIPKGYKIGSLQQHITFSHPTILGEAVSGLPKNLQDEEYRAEIILTGLGFTLSDMEKSPKTLSGGFQLRLQLAKVLLAEPDCLLLDEPTNYLDIVAIRWLEDFLQQWKGEMVVISHDRSFIDSVVTHTMGIYRNQIRRVEGNTGKFYSKMLMEDEIHGKTAEKMKKKRDHMQSFVDRFGAKATKAAQARSREKAIEKLNVTEKLTAMDELEFSFQMAPMPGSRMLEVENLFFSYDTAATNQDTPFAIKDFSVEIEKGTRIAIAGKNGRGKSTLLSLLGGQLIPSQGKWWRSENIAVGHFGQTNIERLHPDMTVEEEISAANPQMPYGQVRSLCGLMMFSGDAAKKRISVLSGGERSRVLLGKILARPCNLLLLDEPTHHLDMESVESLFLAIKNFPGAVILVTHDEDLLHKFAEKMVICRKEGPKVFEGGYENFLRQEGWEKVEETKKKKQVLSKGRKSEEALVLSQIKKLEENIAKEEEKQITLEKKLHRAVEKGEEKEVANFSTSLGTLAASIEKMYQELEKLL